MARLFTVQLGSVTLARIRVRVRAGYGYEFVTCRRHGDQRLPAAPIFITDSLTNGYSLARHTTVYGVGGPGVPPDQLSPQTRGLRP